MALLEHNRRARLENTTMMVQSEQAGPILLFLLSG
jgi:hypothetical protein